MRIDNIIEAIQSNRIRVSDHADEETAADSITLDEILFSALPGEAIEE